jgi:hypothetical protein
MSLHVRPSMFLETGWKTARGLLCLRNVVFAQRSPVPSGLCYENRTCFSRDKLLNGQLESFLQVIWGLAHYTWPYVPRLIPCSSKGTQDKRSQGTQMFR